MSEVLALLDRALDLIAREDDLDPAAFRARIDRQEGMFAKLVAQATKRGDHQLTGRTPVSWVASTCAMSSTSASDRLCVGEQLEAMPRVAEALSGGEIGYQSAAVICHLRDKLGDKVECLDQEQWIGFARDYTVKNLRWLALHVRYQLDPDGFDKDTEENYEERFLHISEMSGMYHLTGVIDPEGGAALKTAIDSLSKRLGTNDQRTPKQRRADALVEIAHHAMNQGTLPRRNGVRPHMTITTTIEGLKAELGAPASDLMAGMPVSSKTVQRLACDGTLSRVLKADSMVVDVGRATRAVSPAQWRALKARHTSCCFPGCDRPINWTSPHHVEFWSRNGHSNLRNLLPLCYHHHRLVHEGGWQVVKAGEGYRFIAPDRVWTGTVRRRWGERAA